MRRIAGWNSARDVWEAGQVDVISQRSDVYSETFTISGMTVNGVAYELPTSAHHMDASGSLFSQLGGKLPDGALVFDTPDTMPDAPNGGSNRRTHPAGLGNQVKLLPSPVAQPSGNTPDDHLRKKPGRAVVTDLAIIVENGLLETGGRLLPTPKAGDADFGMPRTSGRPPEKSTYLMTRLAHTSPNAMLPTPRATRGGSATEIAYGFGGERSDDYRGQGSVELRVDASWGPYAAAIERWEAVLSRPAPDPTELGPKGGRRLSAAFVEWMMGLPEGWVTDPVLELSRTQQLRALGNGVVPKQAEEALKQMADRTHIR